MQRASQIFSPRPACRAEPRSPETAMPCDDRPPTHRLEAGTAAQGFEDHARLVSHKIANRKLTHVYLAAGREAMLYQMGVDAEWVRALKSRVGRARGYALRKGLLVEEHAVHKRLRLRCGWSFFDFGWCASVSPAFNPHVALAAKVREIVAPSLPSCMNIDDPDGFSVVGLSCEWTHEAQARQWMSTRFLELREAIAGLCDRAPPLRLSRLPQLDPARLERTVYRYFRVRLAEVRPLDEALAQRMALLALDLRAAALGRELALTPGEQHGEGMRRELAALQQMRSLLQERYAQGVE